MLNVNDHVRIGCAILCLSHRLGESINGRRDAPYDRRRWVGALLALNEPLHDCRSVRGPFHSSVRLVQNEVKVRLFTLDRLGQDFPERKPTLVGSALDKTTGLRELLGVEEISAFSQQEEPVYRGSYGRGAGPA